MKKLKNLWQRLPRPARAMMNLAVALVLAVVFYVSLGSPALTPEHAFRQEERANFVGPSTILFSADVDNYDFSHLILAETDRGVITFASNDTSNPRFNYFEKNGDATLVAAPKHYWLWGMDNLAWSLPVFVVDDHPEAVRAELELHISGRLDHTVNGVYYEEVIDESFFAESQREGEGYFRFSLDLPFVPNFDDNGDPLDVSHGSRGYALDALSYRFSESGGYFYEVEIAATVRLFGSDDTLLLEQVLEF